MAIYGSEPVGVVALIKMNHHEYDYEVAKMAVSPLHQGKSIGYLLGEKCKEYAKNLGAKKLYLESNTILKPAINLYRKLGFIEVAGLPSPYARANIKMALQL